MKITNVIFDVGGVILDIDFKKMQDAFERLGALNFKEIFDSEAKEGGCIYEYGIGKIESKTFRDRFREKLDIREATDKEFDDAFNAMLGEIPQNKIDAIKKLREEGYNLFVFSNTNEIHVTEINRIYEEQHKKHNGNEHKESDEKFESLFNVNGVYYSHELHERKPGPKGYEIILATSHLAANETLFIDDTEKNVIAAEQLGIHGLHYVPTEGLSFYDHIKGAIEKANKELSNNPNDQLVEQSLASAAP